MNDLKNNNPEQLSCENRDDSKVSDTLNNVYRLIIKKDYQAARNQFNLINDYGECPVIYYSCLARLQLEFREYDELYNTLNILIVPQIKNIRLLDTIKGHVQNCNWDAVSLHVNLTSPFLKFFRNADKAIYLIYILIMDYHNINRPNYDLVRSDLKSIKFENKYEFYYFYNKVLELTDGFIDSGCDLGMSILLTCHDMKKLNNFPSD